MRAAPRPQAHARPPRRTPPFVTPLHPGGTVDPDGLAAVVRHVIAGGVHGLLVFGVTGGAAQPSDADRRPVIDTVAATSRMPLLVQVTDARLAEPLAPAHHAAAAGRSTGAGFAAPVGVAPMSRDCGTRRGRRATRGGGTDTGGAPSMAAWVAERRNLAVKAHAERLAAAGKPFKVVPAACMRKTLVVPNTMVRTRTAWNANLVLGA